MFRTARSAAPGALAAAVLALAALTPAAGAFPTSGATIWTIGGTGVACATAPACGDGGAATTAQLNDPEGAVVDPAGNLYVSDAGDNELRKITPAGVITTVAGDGHACTTAPACGDGGPATSAQLNFPSGLAIDGAGNLYIADFSDFEVRKVATDGTITTVAGDGHACTTSPACGDGGPATSAQLTPFGVAVDGAGAVYTSDFSANEVHEISGGTITRVAGTGVACSNPTATPACGDGGPASAARLFAPAGLALDAHGDLFVADSDDQRVREVTPAGTITTVAGNGSACTAAPACGDGGAATSASLHVPMAVAVAPSGALYIADTSAHDLRRVSGTTITRVAGTGTACATAPACGDGGSATAAQLNFPDAVTVDATGNVYLGDSFDHEVRWLTGPQAGATGPAGSTGATGPAGAPGPQGARGPAGAPGRDGQLVLVAYMASAAHGVVTVRYALTGAAPITLTLAPAQGSRTLVVHTKGHAGLNQLRWNERVRGHRVHRGHYTLIVTATVGARRVSSALPIRL